MNNFDMQVRTKASRGAKEAWASWTAHWLSKNPDHAPVSGEAARATHLDKAIARASLERFVWDTSPNSMRIKVRMLNSPMRFQPVMDPALRQGGHRANATWINWEKYPVEFMGQVARLTALLRIRSDADLTADPHAVLDEAMDDFEWIDRLQWKARWMTVEHTFSGFDEALAAVEALLATPVHMRVRKESVRLRAIAAARWIVLTLTEATDG